MFTGIVQDIGCITSYELQADSLRMSIETNLSEQHLTMGASVACNGCCLTVVALEKRQSKNIFTVEAGVQTLELTNFKKLGVGSYLNLEPALKMGDAIGGHLVTGHVDGVCTIMELSPSNDQFWKLRIQVPEKFRNWIVPKGSIAVAGISLTIADIVDDKVTMKLIVEIMIIPHTYNHTVLKYFAKNNSIEVECDQNVKAIASIVKNMLPNLIGL